MLPLDRTARAHTATPLSQLSPPLMACAGTSLPPLDGACAHAATPLFGVCAVPPLSVSGAGAHCEPSLRHEALGERCSSAGELPSRAVRSERCSE
jgi:hypothetical protein